MLCELIVDNQNVSVTTSLHSAVKPLNLPCSYVAKSEIWNSCMNTIITEKLHFQGKGIATVKQPSHTQSS